MKDKLIKKFGKNNVIICAIALIGVMLIIIALVVIFTTKKPDIIGTWRSIQSTGYADMGNYEEQYTFNKDKTCIRKISMFGKNTTQSCTYKLKRDKIYILIKEHEENAEWESIVVNKDNNSIIIDEKEYSSY